MKAGNDRSHAQALAQEYMTKLVHESAPASYLPMLASLVQAPLLPLALKVPFPMCSLHRCALVYEGHSERGATETGTTCYRRVTYSLP